MQNSNPEADTLRWLMRIVVGMDLCPFAGSALAAKSLKIEVSAATQRDDLLADILTHLDKFQKADEAELATSLLVFSHALSDFEEYWDMAELATDLVVEVGLDNIVQIATFHPEYCFDGVDRDDISHYTNRSPYPMLHFLRESQLTRVLESYSRPEDIPKNNIRRLEAMGKTDFLKLLSAK